MFSSTSHTKPFLAAGLLVRRRLFLRDLLERLGGSAGYAGGLALLGVLFVRLTGHAPAGWPVLGGILGLWLAGCLLVAWRRRPDAAGALAVWDATVDAHEEFLSALHFETTGDNSEGARLHLLRAGEKLPQRLAQIKQNLPVRVKVRQALGPLLAAAFAVSPFLIFTLPGEGPLSGSDREGIQQTGGKVGDVRAQLAALKTPDPAEQKKLEELERKLKETASKLEKNKFDSQREALEELEERAREAEKLSQGLFNSSDDSLSEGMLNALEQHAETDALAAALRGAEAANIAKSLADLADKLADPKTSLQERERVRKAFQDALAAANAKDKSSRLGKALDESLKELQKRNPAAAAEALRRLSKSLSESARRMAMQKKLQQLAQQLRNAGQNMTGRLAPAPSSLANLPSGATGQNSLPMPGNFSPSSAPGAPPGSSFAPPGRMMPGGRPGQRPGSMPGGMAPVPGSAPMPGGMGAGGMAPVPGSAPGAMAGGGVPGGMGSQPGGSQAGNGTTGLGGAKTDRIKPSNTDTVSGTPGAGPGQVHYVTGKGGKETSAVAQQQTILQQIGQAEAGLDDEPLPLSRREQVRKYFTIMRSRAAEAEPAP